MTTNAGSGWTKAAVLVASALVSWQMLYVAVGDVALRPPLDTFRYLGRIFSDGMIYPHLWETLRAFGGALAIAVVGGLFIGFLLGYSRFAGEIFEPMLVAAYSIPKITLYPILLLAFGLGVSAKIAFGAIHGIIPIAIFTLNAVRNIRPVLLKTARAMDLSPPDLARSILFPAALPEIFTGLRIGFALTLVGTLLGEMFASQRGLGHLLMNAIGLHNVDMILAVTLMLVIFAATVSSVLLHYDRKLHQRL